MPKLGGSAHSLGGLLSGERGRSAVKFWSPLEIGLAAGAGAVLLSAGTFAYLRMRRKNDPAEIERLRRLSLGRTGRIAAAEVTGLIEPAEKNSALMLVYRYDVAGVTYEVMQDISTMPAVAAEARHLIAKSISIKYETKHPSNSIAACEVWSGISGVAVGEKETLRQG
jgi:hypothetical protein